MVHAGQDTSEVSRSGMSAFADAETRGAAERRRTALALITSLVLAAVVIGVVAVGIGLVVPNAPDRGINVEGTLRRDSFLDALRTTPGVSYVVEPSERVRSGGYDAPPERIDVTVSGTPAELEAVFTALCEHGGNERRQGLDYVFDVSTDVAPMVLQCEDPALAPRLAALVALARATPAEGMGSIRVQVVGPEVSLWARPAPEAVPEAWRWASAWTTGVLDLGLTPVEVRLTGSSL